MAEQGETYAKFIEAELKAEDERKATLNSRALGIATTSSAFLALVFTLTVLVTGKDFKVSASGSRWILFALVLFAVASLLGLLASSLRAFVVIAPESLEALVGDHWTDEEVDARNQIAYLNVQTISTIRTGNNWKATLIGWGIGFQLSAILVLIGTLAWELRAFA